MPSDEPNHSSLITYRVSGYLCFASSLDKIISAHGFQSLISLRSILPNHISRRAPRQDRGGTHAEMLHDLSETVGTTPLILGLLLLFVAAYRHRIDNGRGSKLLEERDKRSLSDQTPPCIASSLPFVGHMLGYARNGHSYFSNLWYVPQIVSTLDNHTYH